MKKLISILLAILLLVSVLPMAAFAEEELTDTLEFVNSKTVTSKSGLFTLTTNRVDNDGWFGGSHYDLTIRAEEDALLIKSIEAEIGWYSHLYGGVGVSGTAVKEEPYPTEDGQTVTVSNINSLEFSFAGGSYPVQFKDITVHYTKHSHSFDENNMCVCGARGCDGGQHVFDNGICVICHYFDETKHTHIFDDNNVCACGVKGCDIGEHSYKYTCEFCGEEAPENDTPEGAASTASIFFHGNLAIITAIAGLAVGVAGTLLITKKKKSA